MFIFSLVMAASLVSIRVYGAMAAEQSIFVVMQVLVAVMFALIAMAYIYLFPMMVTYRLKIFHLLKNSFLLALGRLPLSIVFALIAVFPLLLGLIIYIFTASYIPLLVMAAYYVVFGMSLGVYINCAYSNATFDKFMPAEKAPAAPEDEDNDDFLSFEEDE